jgi:hypothetical protein
MSAWIDVGNGHRIQLLENGGLIWEHDAMPGYWVSRHQVSSVKGEVWTVQSLEPLTLNPSLHCAEATGGCGMHGFVVQGRWT